MLERRRYELGLDGSIGDATVSPIQQLLLRTDNGSLWRPTRCNSRFLTILLYEPDIVAFQSMRWDLTETHTNTHTHTPLLFFFPLERLWTQCIPQLLILAHEAQP